MAVAVTRAGFVDDATTAAAAFVACWRPCAARRQIANRIAIENFTGEQIHVYQTTFLKRMKEEFDYQIALRHYVIEVQMYDR